MSLLQNAIIILTGFLLSEMLVFTRTHHRLIGYLLQHSGNNPGSLLTAILLISYTLSIFLSHTIVVISMIPVINRLLTLVQQTDEKKTAASFFYLALTFGSNTGGMASLAGSPQNLLAIALAEFYKFKGRDLITFFSWIVVGLPATLLLLFFGRTIILYSMKSVSIPSLFSSNHNDPSVLPHKPLILLIGSLLLISTLTALQFFFKPAPVLFAFNTIDLCFLLYGAVFLFVALILPTERFSLRVLFMNTLFFVIHLLGFPLIFISQLCKELESRMGLPLKYVYTVIDRSLLRLFGCIWNRCFQKPFTDFETPNAKSMLSINIIIRDLPYFGIALILIIGTMLFALFNAWDNPQTPEVDGYLLKAVKSAILGTIEPFSNKHFRMFALVFAIIFSSELLSNTALILMLAPMASALAAQTALSPVIMLLTITIAASSAFMTPVAATANTLAFGGIEKVSLRMILLPGFVMNISSALLTVIVFSGLSLIVP
jgi:sodium-dependent dicarboxylate transporter 2/3/5